MNYGGFLGGDGWQMDAGDSRGDSANQAGTGSFGERKTVINKGGAVSMTGLIGIGAVVLGGMWMMTR